jgi:hypothetical protein
MIRRLALAALACASTLAAVEPLSAAVEPPAELAPALSARDELARSLSERLRSDDPHLQAWAAYEVGAHRVTGAREALLPLLAQVPPKEDEPASCRYRSALDALNRLDGMAPPAVVAGAAADPRFRAQAIILAARDAATNHDALLALLDATLDDASWLAVCELLEDSRAPKLAQHLLGGLNLKLALTVSEEHVGGSSGMFSSRFGTSRLTFPDGFPPYPLYYLTTKPEPGAVILTGRYATVYWIRAEVEKSGSGYCKGDSSVDRDAARIDLLGRLTRPWSLPQLKPMVHETVVWKDAAAYRTEAVADYEKIDAERQRILDALIEQHVLPPDAPQRVMKPIEVTLLDLRHDRSEPLPELPFPVKVVERKAAEPAPPAAVDER